MGLIYILLLPLMQYHSYYYKCAFILTLSYLLHLSKRNLTCYGNILLRNNWLGDYKINFYI